MNTEIKTSRLLLRQFKESDYDEKAEPFVLFYEGDIGIYPYFSMGTVYICIVPITQDYLTDLTLKGSELVEINYTERKVP